MTAIPPQYAQNVFDWEAATDERPVYWIGPDNYTADGVDPLYVVWKAWSDGQAVLAGRLPLHAAMEITDALRWHRGQRR